MSHPAGPLIAAVASVALLGAAHPVRAEPGDSKGPPARGRNAAASVPDISSEQFDDLITTARRRNEGLQSSPVAVTAFEAEAIRSRDVRSLEDLDGLAPNVAIDTALGASATGRLTIRGVGLIETTTSFDPGVGVYIDGAYVPRSQGQLLSLFDVESIEILRGPQGALFGKNTIGGAINVTTRKPEFDYGADGSVRVGNFGRVDTRLTLNAPLTRETAALRLSLASNYDTGTERNGALSERLATDRLLGVRAQLLMLPTSDMEISLSAEYTRQDRKPQGARCIPIASPSPLATLALGTQLAEDIQTACSSSQQLGERRIASDGSADDDFRVLQLNGTLTWEISDDLKLRSITAFRDQRYDLKQDLDGTVLATSQSPRDQGAIRSSSFSQELQLSGHAADDRLFFVLGLFAFGERIDDDTSGGASLLAPELQRRFSLPESDPRSRIGFPLPVVEEIRDLENRSFAGYVSLTYALTSRLSATVGLRRTLERRRLEKRDIARTPGVNLRTLQPPFFTNPPARIEAGDLLFERDRSARFSDFSPNASLTYQLTPTILGYASYSTGFRTGGFNGRVSYLNPSFGEVAPEELTTYEVGVKSSLLDSRLTLNVAGFYSIYEDIQRSILSTGVADPLSVSLQNAAEARLEGAEIELSAILLPGLRLESSIGTFRGRYTDFDQPNLSDIEDARQPGQPNYLMTFAVDYERAVSWLGEVSSRVQWTHRGQQANDPRDSRSIRSSKYGLMNASLSVELNDGKTELAIFGSNLLDRDYLSNGIDASDVFGQAVIFQGQPRRYGLELRRRF